MINLKFLEFICSKYVIDFFCFFFSDVPVSMSLQITYA